MLSKKDSRVSVFDCITCKIKDSQFYMYQPVFRINTEDPVEGTRQITTGFRKWAERYIGNCGGQRKNQHQVRRMNRWNQKLQQHLADHLNEGSGMSSAEIAI